MAQASTAWTACLLSLAPFGMERRRSRGFLLRCVRSLVVHFYRLFVDIRRLRRPFGIGALFELAPFPLERFPLLQPSTRPGRRRDARQIRASRAFGGYSFRRRPLFADFRGGNWMSFRKCAQSRTAYQRVRGDRMPLRKQDCPAPDQRAGRKQSGLPHCHQRVALRKYLFR